jgi:hypothetical protein
MPSMHGQLCMLSLASGAQHCNAAGAATVTSCMQRWSDLTRQGRVSLLFPCDTAGVQLGPVAVHQHLDRR